MAVQLASQSSEPVGCGAVIVSGGEIIAAECNSQRADNIAVHHAEVKAIVAANKKSGNRTLVNAIAYCSCEPCAMCLTALSYAKIKRIVYHKTMYDVAPNDPQSQLNARDFVAGLNFTPELQQITEL